MKRFAGLLAAVVLSLMFTVGMGASPTQAVGACGYQWSGQTGTWQKAVYSIDSGGEYGYIDAQLIAYDNQCGSKYYIFQAWEVGFNPQFGRTDNVYIRTWLNGTFYRTYHWVLGGVVNDSVATPAICCYHAPYGNQADTAGTSISFNGTPSPIYPYVNL